MQEIVNTFEGGLFADAQKQLTKSNQYLYAENIRLIGENAQNVSLENILGNTEISRIIQCAYINENEYIPQTLILDNTFRAIGITTLRDIAIILISNGAIGYIVIHQPDIDEQNHAVYSVIPLTTPNEYASNIHKALAFDVEYHHTYAEIRSDGKIYYYIAGRNNKKSRAVVLSNTCKNCNSEVVGSNALLFEFFLDSNYTEDNFDALTQIIPYSKDPVIHLKGYDNPLDYYLAGIKNQGNIQSGNWRYAIRYIDAFGNKTNWSPVTAQIPIYEAGIFQDRHINWNKIYGSQQETICSKTVTLEIYNWDSNFVSLELAGIHTYSTVENAYIIKQVFYDPNTLGTNPIVIEHTGYEVYQTIDVGEITIKKANVFNFKTLSCIDNVLFVAGIKETLAKNFLPYQEIADQISLLWKTKTILESEGTFSTHNGDIYDTGSNLLETVDARPKVGNYKYPYHCYYTLGYFRDEDYSFGIQFKLKDGTLTPVFPIGKADLNTMITGLTQSDTANNGDDCSGALRRAWGQSLNTNNLLRQDNNDTYDIDIDFCRDNKTYSYFREHTYVYHSPAHIADYEIIDGDPADTKDVNDVQISVPYNQNDYMAQKAYTDMGKPRNVKVLYPEFNNINIPDELNIEGFYILRVDREDYSKIKQTGLGTFCTLDGDTNFNDYQGRPVSPVFINYTTKWSGSSVYDNWYRIAGQMASRWTPVFGFYPFDEIYAKDQYQISPEDILEFIYSNNPIHADAPNACGFPELDIDKNPVTAKNLLEGSPCTFLSPSIDFDYGDLANGTVLADLVKNLAYIQRLFVNLWVGAYNKSVFPTSPILPLGQYSALSGFNACVANMEVNLWQRIQNKVWGMGRYRIGQVINKTLQNSTYTLNNYDTAWLTDPFNTGNTTLKADFLNKSIVITSDSCGDKEPILMYEYPSKLISVKEGWSGMNYGVGGDSDISPLSGYGLVFYVQIRKSESRYPAPIYRNYHYASLYVSCENPQQSVIHETITETPLTNGKVISKVATFGGDCFIGKYYLHQQRYKGSPFDDTLNNVHSGVDEVAIHRSLHISAYIEAKHNIAVQFVKQNEDGSYPNFGDFPFFPLAGTDADRENADLFSEKNYDLGYTPNLYPTFAQIVKDFTNEEDATRFTVRYSLTHVDGMREDNYRVFLPNNFKDVVRKHGEIVALETLGGHLFIAQEDGIGKLFINQETQIQGDTGTILLGTGSVVSDKLNYFADPMVMGCQDLMGFVNVGRYIAMFDKKRKNIFTITPEKFENLTLQKGLKSIQYSLIYEHEPKNLGVFIGNDENFGETLFKLKHTGKYRNADVEDEEIDVAEVLALSENLQTFTSFYTFSPDIMYSLNNQFFSAGNNGGELNLMKHNVGRRGEFYGEVKNSKIIHVVVPKVPAVYGSIKIIGNSDVIGKKFRIFNDRIEVFPLLANFRTSYQYAHKIFYNNINIRDILYSHQANLPLDNILYKEQVWHTDFPFVDGDTDITINAEKNLAHEYLSEERLRDYFCQVEWVLNNGEGFALDSEDYAKYGNKRYRWLSVLYYVNPSFI